MNIQDEKDLLDSYLWHASKVLDITPKEVRARVREACDRTRKFYRWYLDDYEIALTTPWVDISAIQGKARRLERLGLKQK